MVSKMGSNGSSVLNGPLDNLQITFLGSITGKYIPNTFFSRSINLIEMTETLIQVIFLVN